VSTIEKGRHESKAGGSIGRLRETWLIANVRDHQHVSIRIFNPKFATRGVKRIPYGSDADTLGGKLGMRAGNVGHVDVKKDTLSRRIDRRIRASKHEVRRLRMEPRPRKLAFRLEGIAHREAEFLVEGMERFTSAT